MPSNPVPELLNVASQFKEAHDKKTASSTDQMIAAYTDILNNLGTEIQQIVGATDFNQKAWKQEALKRLAQLVLQTQAQLGEYAKTASNKISQAQLDSIQAAQKAANGLLASAAKESGVKASFSQLPTPAIEKMVGLTQDGSPLREVMDGIFTDPAFWEQFKTTMINGIAVGKNPKVVAREIKEQFGGKLGRALTVARTESMRAYRESTLQIYEANKDIIDGWFWYASVNVKGPKTKGMKTHRTCASCLAHHGQFFALTEAKKLEDWQRQNSHPNCRCTMVPHIKDTPYPNIKSGIEIYQDMDPGEVKAMVHGNQKLAKALLTKQLSLMDLIKITNSPKWGEMRRMASYEEALQNHDVNQALAVPKDDQWIMSKNIKFWQQIFRSDSQNIGPVQKAKIIKDQMMPDWLKVKEGLMPEYQMWANYSNKGYMEMPTQEMKGFWAFGQNLEPKPAPDWKTIPDKDYWYEPKDFDVPNGKLPGSGIIGYNPIDSSFILITPTNNFGGYENTFPKGKQEQGLSLQQNALKEFWEETGLHADIKGWVCDTETSTSKTRFYVAEITGGATWDIEVNPKLGFKEVQSVKLAKLDKIEELLNQDWDKQTLQKLKDYIANPPPKEDPAKVATPPDPAFTPTSTPTKVRTDLNVTMFFRNNEEVNDWLGSLGYKPFKFWQPSSHDKLTNALKKMGYEGISVKESGFQLGKIVMPPPPPAVPSNILHVQTKEDVFKWIQDQGLKEFKFWQPSSQGKFEKLLKKAGLEGAKVDDINFRFDVDVTPKAPVKPAVTRVTTATDNLRDALDIQASLDRLLSSLPPLQREQAAPLPVVKNVPSSQQILDKLSPAIQNQVRNLTHGVAKLSLEEALKAVRENYPTSYALAYDDAAQLVLNSNQAPPVPTPPATAPVPVSTTSTATVQVPVATKMSFYKSSYQTDKGNTKFGHVWKISSSNSGGDEEIQFKDTDILTLPDNVAYMKMIQDKLGISINQFDTEYAYNADKMNEARKALGVKGVFIQKTNSLYWYEDLPGKPPTDDEMLDLIPGDHKDLIKKVAATGMPEADAINMYKSGPNKAVWDKTYRLFLDDPSGMKDILKAKQNIGKFGTASFFDAIVQASTPEMLYKYQEMEPKIWKENLAKIDAGLTTGAPKPTPITTSYSTSSGVTTKKFPIPETGKLPKGNTNGIQKAYQPTEYQSYKAPEISGGPVLPKFAGFPDDPKKLKVIQRLGGSTGAQLVEDPSTGKKYVMKKGNNPGHLREEVYSDAAYYALGVPVPKFALFETPDGPVKLSEYYDDAVPLSSVSLDAKAKKALQAHFAVDALMGNWDVAGMSLDNIMYRKSTGEFIRIDNGGSLRYRAQGAMKSDKEWNAYPVELWTLRNAKTNGSTSKVFGDVDYHDLVDQMASILEKQEDLLKVLPPEVRTVMQQRLEQFHDLHYAGSNFKGDKYVSTYTDNFSEQLVGIRKEGLSSQMPKQMLSKSNDDVFLYDENGKAWDSMRGSDSLVTKLAKYIKSQGGDYEHISDWQGSQAGDSWNKEARIFKWHWVKNRSEAIDSYWWKTSATQVEKEYKSYTKGKEQEYNVTIAAHHAFVWDFLLKTETSRSAGGFVTVMRTENQEVMALNKLKKGTSENRIKRGAAESCSFMKRVSVYGSELTRMKIPIHRVLGMYIMERRPGYNSAAFLGDGENEFVCLLEGQDMDYDKY